MWPTYEMASHGKLTPLDTLGGLGFWRHWTAGLMWTWNGINFQPASVVPMFGRWKGESIFVTELFLLSCFCWDWMCESGGWWWWVVVVQPMEPNELVTCCCQTRRNQTGSTLYVSLIAGIKVTRLCLKMSLCSSFPCVLCACLHAVLCWGLTGPFNQSVPNTYIIRHNPARVGNTISLWQKQWRKRYKALPLLIDICIGIGYDNLSISGVLVSLGMRLLDCVV